MSNRDEDQKEILKNFYKSLGELSEKHCKNEDEKREIFFETLANLCSIGVAMTARKEYGAFSFAGNAFVLIQYIVDNVKSRFFDKFSESVGLPKMPDNEESTMEFLENLKNKIDKK